ncbi:MAG: bifunctional transcriptional activator/DNA repair enzyme AdaA [Cobetia crustatorum]
MTAAYSETDSVQANKTAADEALWQRVLSRQGNPGETIRYGVITTGIFCRVGCPSPSPLRDNVRIYPDNQTARAAGLRACRRCHPESEREVGAIESNHWLLATCRQLEAAIAAGETAPSLATLATRAGLSTSHLQRRFKTLLGLSPAEYASGLRQLRFHDLLEQGSSVTDAILAAGYRSTSRAYARADGISPSVRQQGGKGETLLGLHWPCSFGIPEQHCWLSAGVSERGVVVIQLTDSREAGQQALEARLPKACWQHIDPQDENGQSLHAVLGARLLVLCEQPEISHALFLELPLDIRGTAFQLTVWQQLNATLSGNTLTYRQLAEALERPTASRAVANACGANPLALLTPCHRVVRGDGGLGGYRWGVELKQARLAQEAETTLLPEPELKPER